MNDGIHTETDSADALANVTGLNAAGGASQFAMRRESAAMPDKTAVNQVTPPDITGRNFVSAPEAAAYLGVDIRTVRRAIGAGEIPATRVGAAWRVPTVWLRHQAAPGGQS